MSAVSSNNKRIAKNTLFLYIRTIIVMFVALYTSRLVFHALGEIDLGIYNLVGTIVTMLAFLQTAQAKATSRFITYELGKSDTPDTQKRIFSLCMTIHLIIGVVVIVLAETVGLWIINEFTDIPPERMFAANVVYQFSILTFLLHLVRVPYDAVIIAHEDMSVYAYMSVFEVMLQLGVVYLIMVLQTDNLILYGALIAVVAFIVFLCYALYTRYKYREYRFRWMWSKEDSMQIMKFSGWTLLGSSSNTATQQGVNLLFNNFVGLVANTALGFANQVNAAVTRFISSFTTAFNPQITKFYACQDLSSMHLLMTRAAKFSFVLCYLMTLPLIVNMDYILHLWLGDVPLYTVEFCQLILVCSTIDATTGVYNTAITATGKIRNYQIGIAISFLLDLLCAVLLLMMDMHPAIVFGSRILTRGFLNMCIGMYYGNKLLDYDWKVYVRCVLFPIAVILFFSVPVVGYFSMENQGWIRLLITTIVSTTIIGVATWTIVMTRDERIKIGTMLVRKKKQ